MQNLLPKFELITRYIAPVAAVALLFVASLYAADEKPTPPLPTKFRISGMFSPERETDLRELAKDIMEFKITNIDYPNSEVTLEYELPKLFSQSNPKQLQMLTPEKIVERLDNLLRAASNSTFRIFAASNTPKDKLAVEEIMVGVLDCKGCCLAVHDTVAKIDGVERATIDSKTGQLSVTIDPAKTNRAALEETLKKANIPVITKK